MAWNNTKQKMLRRLLEERVRVDNSFALATQWGLTRTWEQIINSHADDIFKQNVLNDLIDDRVDYMNIQRDDASATMTSIDSDIISLNNLKI